MRAIGERYVCTFVAEQTLPRLADMYSSVDVIISNRLHGLLFASAQGAVPLGLLIPECNQKIIGILEDLGLDDHWIDVEAPDKAHVEISELREKVGDVRTAFARSAKLISDGFEALAAHETDRSTSADSPPRAIGSHEAVFWGGMAALFEIASRLTALVVLSRLLSPSDFGLYGIGVSIALILATFAQLGVPTNLIYLSHVDRKSFAVASIFCLHLEPLFRLYALFSLLCMVLSRTRSATSFSPSSPM